MSYRLSTRVFVVLITVCIGGMTPSQRVAAQSGRSEVWVTDQSGTAGRLFIYDAHHVHQDAATARPEILLLDPDNDPGTETVGDRCLSQTGTAPTRGHMLAFNLAETHGILSFVATGHVAFIDAATRRAVSCIDVGAQAHAAFPAPDGSYVVVAN
ncbi:MAG TPA: hypothetical protein VMO26_21235 [Vicinamibacterales bacterium]|nr:hypothetical protein [Vicinamibacterales bacterium]